MPVELRRDGASRGTCRHYSVRTRSSLCPLDTAQLVRLRTSMSAQHLAKYIPTAERLGAAGECAGL